MPKPYPKEFRDDVVRVARNRQPGQQLKQIAADFGISESCLTNWLKRADVEDGNAPAITSEQNADLPGSEVHACALLPVARSSGDRGRAGLGVPRERVVRCAP